VAAGRKYFGKTPGRPVAMIRVVSFNGMIVLVKVVLREASSPRQGLSSGF